MSARLTDEQLRELAVASFDVLNWARRLGLRRDAQIAEVVKAFEVTLGYRKPVTGTTPAASIEAAARLVGGDAS